MQWIKKPFDKEQFETLKKQGVFTAFCTLLSNRNFPWVRTKRDIGTLVESSLSLIEDSDVVANMKEGAEFLVKVKGAHAVIFGDYDADGIMSAFMCEKLLLALQATTVDTYLPTRENDGYGLNNESVENFLAICKKDYRLVVVLDCGTSSKDQIEKIKKHLPKAKIVIIDHHIVDNDKYSSNADCVVNPRLNDSTAYCAAGLVYQMARECAKYDNKINHLSYITYAAIATITDVCPLIGSNRILVKNGLNALKMCQDIGISSLFKVAEIDKTKCDVENISFGVGPMINASGRIKVAAKAFQLLRKKDEAKAIELAQELKDLNEKRKKIQKVMAEEALKQFEDNRNGRNCAVLYNENWNPSIVGIVASKVVDKYQVPTLCFGKDREKIKGSARSVHGVNVKEVMDCCKHLFLKHGGHEMAAGATLDPQQLDNAWNDFNKAVEKYRSENKIGEPVSYYDLEVDQELMMRVDENFCDRLSMLEPFGQSNEVPVFLAQKMFCREVKMWKSGAGGFVTVDNVTIQTFTFLPNMKSYENKDIDFLFSIKKSFMGKDKWNIKILDARLAK
jgi:single-stranded-DNA-specific exonuclease